LQSKTVLYRWHLNTLVHLPDVLDGEAGVIDLKRARKVGLPEVPECPPFKVKILQRPLQGRQAGVNVLKLFVFIATLSKNE
jgi:hypothetical protein